MLPRQGAWVRSLVREPDLLLGVAMGKKKRRKSNYGFLPTPGWLDEKLWGRVLKSIYRPCSSLQCKTKLPNTSCVLKGQHVGLKYVYVGQMEGGVPT